VQFDRVLTTFADFFARERIRYALIGGLAVHAWGRVRPTRDADFAVDATRSQQVIAFAESLGFATRYASDAFSNHVHSDPAWGQVDFMYLRGRTADSVFAAASPKPLLETHPMPVASPEHLAMMKALAMKDFPHRALYDGEDVATLLKVPGVDREAVGTTSRATVCWSCSMPSKRPRAEPLDSFEADVRVTPEDIAAQRRLRSTATMTSKEYLDWCSWITRDSIALRDDFPKEPFELELVPPHSP
jgi:hypothetical protein